jgi:serine/threonine protein kinase
LAVAYQVTDALRYIHQRRLVHRDLKPKNLIALPVGGIVKLFDFGLAKWLDGYEIFGPKPFFGTPEYIAPELIPGGLQSALPASDYFSLGIALYEMLAGQLPMARDIWVKGNALTVSFPEKGPCLNAESLARVPGYAHFLLNGLLQNDPVLRLANPDKVQDEIRACLAAMTIEDGAAIT